MANEIRRVDVSALIATYESIRTSVTFTHGAAGGTGTTTVNVTNLNSPVPEKVTLESLRSCINDLFAKFSTNCNCLDNTDCCQTCQTTTCQTQCVTAGCQSECNAMSNQRCQTTTCQTQCTTANQGCQVAANQAQCATGNQSNQGNQGNQSQCRNCSSP